MLVYNNIICIIRLDTEFKLFLLDVDRVGRNVAAGMTGGLAYLLDEDDTLIPKVCSIFALHYRL